jgi:hypothetical protein
VTLLGGRPTVFMLYLGKHTADVVEGLSSEGQEGH